MLCTSSKISVLYLSYTGILEPLGRSQVLAYLTRLSDKYSITLVSFEKPEDFANECAVVSLKAECDKFGIQWKPRRYHHRPRLPATVWDLIMLLVDTWKFSRGGRIQLIHCRSYIPTMAACIVGLFTRVPFVFDMRALWPEEMVTAGRLKKTSFTYRALNWTERQLLGRAASVVSLTSAAVVYLKDKYPELTAQHFEVISTCVDLDRVSKKLPAQNHDKNHLVIGSMGTVISGWYHLDWLFTLFKCAYENDNTAQLKIVTRDDHDEIIAQAVSSNIPVDKIQIISSTPDDIAQHIANMSIAALFFASGTGKLGSAPTRMGELLACGIPVIGNRGVGDMAELIEHYQVGVVIESGDIDEMRNALVKLTALLQDTELPTRCRKAAEDYFSVEKGVEKYDSIYRKVSR